MPSKKKNFSIKKEWDGKSYIKHQKYIKDNDMIRKFENPNCRMMKNYFNDKNGDIIKKEKSQSHHNEIYDKILSKRCKEIGDMDEKSEVISYSSPSSGCSSSDERIYDKVKNIVIQDNSLSINHDKPLSKSDNYDEKETIECTANEDSKSSQLFEDKKDYFKKIIACNLTPDLNERECKMNLADKLRSLKDLSSYKEKIFGTDKKSCKCIEKEKIGSYDKNNILIFEEEKSRKNLKEYSDDLRNFSDLLENNLKRIENVADKRFLFKDNCFDTRKETGNIIRHNENYRLNINCSNQSNRIEYNDFVKENDRTNKLSDDSGSNSGDRNFLDFYEKRQRLVLSTPQKEYLRKVFSSFPFPNRAEIDQMSYQLKITPRNVQIWFQNQRQKVKRKLVEEGNYRGEFIFYKNSRLKRIEGLDLLADAAEMVLRAEKIELDKKHSRSESSSEKSIELSQKEDKVIDSIYTKICKS